MHAGTSDEVIKVFDNNFRKLELIERVISDNGPRFKSERFMTFCIALEIKQEEGQEEGREKDAKECLQNFSGVTATQ